MKVTILGCGPAGLLAAQGAADAGADVTIISKKQPSYIAGAQFLHVPIPSIKTDFSQVHIHKRGTAEGYAKKVYGESNRNTSWYDYDDGEVLAAWPMKEVYTRLWERWERQIVHRDITQPQLDWIELCDADMLVSTIPARALCQRPDEHTFATTDIAVTVNDVSVNRYSIIYNGMEKIKWVRASFLFGQLSIEYGNQPRRPGQPNNPTNARLIHKPQWTDCDCRPQFRRAGRYGKWQRGVLAHTAYEEVQHVVAMHRVS